MMLALVPEEADAFTIFESLNARGRELAVSDLMKNHLFSTAGTSRDDVKSLWSGAMARVSEVDETAVPDFLRNFWNSRHEFAREKELYKRLKSEIVSQGDAEEFVLALGEASTHYAALLTDAHTIWRDLGLKVVQAVEALFSFRLEQNRALLLAAMQRLPKEELARLLQWMVSWSVRGLVVGGIGKGKTETTYAKAALTVWAGSASTVEQIFAELETIIPTDLEFAEAFRTYSPPTNLRAHYMLRALEKGKSLEKEAYLVPNPNRQELTIEHTLPRNRKAAEWPSFTDEQAAEYVQRIGNLALVTRQENRRLGNKPFNRKKPTYQKAGLALTRSLAEFEDWDPKAIEKRQAELGDLAPKVWPRTPQKPDS